MFNQQLKKAISFYSDMFDSHKEEAFYFLFTEEDWLFFLDKLCLYKHNSLISENKKELKIFSKKDVSSYSITHIIGSFLNSEKYDLTDYFFLCLFYYYKQYKKESFSLNDLEKLLLSKNEKYGNAVLNPICVFAEKNIEHTISSRIDEKLSRIKNSANNDNEDAYLDILGYLIFYKIVKN